MWGGDDKKNSYFRNFSGDLGVKISPFNAVGVSVVPGWGAKIPYASWPKIQNIKKTKRTHSLGINKTLSTCL